LYERYAELLPDGPQRERAATTARSATVLLGGFDPDRYRTALAPGVEAVDRRTLGLPSGRGMEAVLRGYQALYELSAGVVTRIDDVLDLRPDALLVRWTTSGIERSGGGAFENEFLLLWVFGSAGLMTHTERFDADRDAAALARFDELTADTEGRERRRDIYTLDQLDEARARFAALRVDPLRIPPNTATRTMDRWQEHAGAGAWDLLPALCAPGAVFDDRRRAFLSKGDRDMLLTGVQYIYSRGARPARTLLATSGDALALEHVLWTGGSGTPDFEIEHLRLTEVDGEGRIVALICFDQDDRRAAALEMLERTACNGAERGVPDVLFDGLRAVNAHEVERFRRVLADDFVLLDHRRTGLGQLNGEEYIASLVALVDQSPDVTVETLYTIAFEKYGVLLVARNFGTLREGGDFESVYVRIGMMRGDKVTRVEMFEPENLEVARARFAELGAADD